MKKLGVFTGNAAMRVRRSSACTNTLTLHSPMRSHKTSEDSARRHDLKRLEADAAICMTKHVKIPKQFKNKLYGVRRGRACRLAGTLPELCLALVDQGAPLADVLALPLAIERACVERYVEVQGVTVEKAVQEETAKQYECDTQEFRVLAHPDDERAREDAKQAAQAHRLGLEVLLATLDRKPAA